ncbi:MAG: hypothetical protein M5R38_09485 [Candidatus Methylomirabilis sp.]|nr:hypothetical protein [Candidatus Methylomirabilis sp.]
MISTSFVADDAALAQRLLYAGPGQLRLGEVGAEGRVDQVLAGIPGQPRGLGVHVGDDAVGGDGEQGVGRGLNQRAVVGLLFGELGLQPRLLQRCRGRWRRYLARARLRP